LELEELSETPMGEVDDLESRISRLRDLKQGQEKEVSKLQSVIGFYEEILDAGNATAFGALVEYSSDDVTGQLFADYQVKC
jgi:hypothetical protein